MNDTLKRWIPILYVAAIGAGLIYSGYTTYRDYFLRWATDSGLYEVFDVGVRAIGQTIAGLPEDETVYLSPTWGEHAVLQLHANGREDIRAYNGRHCFVFPQQTENPTSYFIVPSDDKNSLALLASYFPQGESSPEGPMPNGEQYFTIYQIPANSTAQFAPQRPVKANWADQIELLGYDIAETPTIEDGAVAVNIYYRALSEIPRNYVVFVHLWGENYADGITIFGQVDREPCFQSYPTSYWQPGEVIRDTFILPLAPEITAGTYVLATGLYTWPELQRLPLVESDHDVVDNVAILGELDIGPTE